MGLLRKTLFIVEGIIAIVAHDVPSLAASDPPPFPDTAASPVEPPSPAPSGTTTTEAAPPAPAALAPVAPAAPAPPATSPYPAAPSAPVREEPVVPTPSVPSRPPAAPEPTFGEKGQFTVLFDPTVYATSTAYTNSSASVLALAFEPSLEYFFVKNVSIGVELDASHRDQKGYGADGSLVETKRTLVGGGVHFGLNVRLAPTFSIYPMLQLGLHHISQNERLVSGNSLSITASPTGSPSYAVTGPWIEFLLPLLYHPVTHFFVGAAPSVYHDFSRAQGGPNVGAERTTFGAEVLFGGYFDFRTTERAEPGAGDALDMPETASPRGPRFGDRNTFLLADDAALSVYSASYAGTSATVTTVTVAPGLDWFFRERQSLGVALTYGHSSSEGLTTDIVSSASPVSVKQTNDSFGIAVRYGYALALGDVMSLYPRFGLRYSHSAYEETLGAAHNDAYGDAVTGIIDLRLLVQLAPHFLIGLGPSLASEFYQKYNTGKHVEQTTIGIGTLLGGWL